MLRARFLRDVIGLKSFRFFFHSLLVIGHERCQFVASTCQALQSTEQSSQTERLNVGARGVFYGCTAFGNLSYLGTVCIVEALKTKLPLSVHRGM